jgi:putative tryptophan/tyrosine transport system substrate-binding protein
VRRREFIAVVGSATAWPLSASAQSTSKVCRVGLIVSGGQDFWEPDFKLPNVRAFYDGLRDLGYVEGHNLVLKRRSAEGKGNKRAGEIGTELVRDGIDIIVVDTGSMAKEMMGVTNRVPILMAASLDPVAQGIVTNLARPGGNVTGFSIQAGPEFDTKRMQLLKDTVPSLSRVAFLGLRGDWENTTGKALRSVAESQALKLFFAEATPTNYADALALIAKERPDGFIVAANPASWFNRHTIIAFALQHRVPAMFQDRELVDDGGLMSYSVNYPDLWRRVAGYIDRIFKGEKPGELPIQQPTNFELVINLKTARAIGLEIPAPVLAQAAEVIE